MGTDSTQNGSRWTTYAPIFLTLTDNGFFVLFPNPFSPEWCEMRNKTIVLTLSDKRAARKAVLDSRQGMIREDGSL
jgi:putative heme iron utilization protein